MPQIVNDKEVTIARDTNSRILAKIKYLKDVTNQQQRYTIIATLPQLIDQINVNYLEDPDAAIEDYLFSVAADFVVSHKDESKNAPMERMLTSIIRKIVEIYAIRTKNVDSLSFITKLLNKRANLLYRQAAKTSIFQYYPTEKEPNNFYHECVGVTLKELSKYHKIVWEIALKDLTELVNFINLVQPNPLHTKQANELIESLSSEILAYFKSGRPELIKFCTAISGIKALEQSLLKKVDRQSLVKFISELGPSLAETFLRSGDLESKRAGLALMQFYVDYYSFEKYSKYKEAEWKNWINKHEIYEYVFSDCNFCDEIIEKHSNFFKLLKRYKSYEQKTSMLINLLRQKNSTQKLSTFICKELDCYFLDLKSKEILFDYFNSLASYVHAPLQYIQILKELPTRSESEYFAEKAYALIVRIIKTDYEQMSENYRYKYLQAFRFLFSKYSYVFKTKNSETKLKILKEILLQLMTDINSIKILMFNVIIIDGELWKFMSNTPFQNLLTEIVQKYEFFDRIFKYLEGKAMNKVDQKEFIKLIKYISTKITSKQDAIFKYIQIISKFPDIFEELIESSGYSKIQEQMKTVLGIFRQYPETPFHIFTLTFERMNYSSYLDVNKIPSLLQDKKEHNKLTRNPKGLKYYEAITELILETDHQGLRSNLCNFVLSLYFNYKQSKIHGYESGEEALITFLTEILDNFVLDYQQFIRNPKMLKTIIVDLQLIQKSLQFTDILGCGAFKPHKSLVSTSTILLCVSNNVTFGDDVAKVVQRDFPSNMTLFDALTIIGLAFKCGPEDIVLKQNGRFISSIYNSHSLEDLQLTNDEIIAEQNHANTLQTPQILEGKIDYKATQKVKPEMIKIITDVFNRFAFEGKMSLLQCTNYVRQASASQCSSNDRRVREIFDFDSDNDNIITLQDFINYYTKNLTTLTYYKDQMLKGLFNLRYRKNLTLYSQPLDISHQYYLMMRFKIAKNYHNIYDALFKLASHSDSKLSDKAKNLLLYLPSYPQLKSQIAKPIDFSSNTEFQIYYKLIAIENELSTGEGKENMIEAKKAKIESFVNNKNNEIIFMLLSKYHTKVEKSQYEEKSLLICLRILRSLINIEYLSTINIYACKLDKIFIPHLPPTKYFAQHTALAYHSRNIINFETLLVLQLTQQKVDLQSIIKCCFNTEEQIRKISCNFVYLWSIKTQFAYDLFSVPIAETNNQEWFELLCGIIQENNAINLDFLKNAALSILEKRQQTFQNQYDHLMYGYLKLLSSIAKKEKLATNTKLEEIFIRLLHHSLSEKNRTLIFELIKNQNRSVGYKYFDGMLSSILPSQQCLIRQKYVGIKNLGAICYINSILQQFFMIDKFKHMVLNKSVPKEVESAEVNGKIIVDDFMYQFQKLYHHLEYSQKKYLVPRQFCHAFKNYEGLPINTSIQEDAHEFLNRLMEHVEGAFKKENQLQQLEKILTIKKLTQIECYSCKNKIDKYQNDYCLMIEVKNHDNLLDSLRKYTQKEEIADYFCQICKKKMDKISKRTYLNQLPETVILNLQRIVYDQFKGQKVKVHTQLSFPQAIDFSEFIKNDDPTIKTNYSLKGVVIHTGTSQGGHYYSIIKTKRYGWLKFNDQNVTPFDQKDIERETFGGFEAQDGWGDVTYSTNAYILFYERNDVPGAEFIEAQNEFTQQLQNENVKLINQLQIHQESFFNAIIASYEMIRPPNLDQIYSIQPYMQAKPSKEKQMEYLELMKITQKAFSFLNVYTEIKQEIRVKIGKIMRQLYFILPQQTLTFFKQTNINTYIENIISNSTNNQREILKQTFLQLLVIHCRYYNINLSILTEQSKYIFDILDTVLSYMQSKLFYSNIIKVSSYLQFWDLLMKNFKSACNYLFSKDYFFKLLDLIMGKESPFMKHHPIAQDLPINLLPTVFNSIDNLLQFKINLKAKKIFEYSTVPTTSLEAAILANPNFYRRIMRLKYDHPSLSHIITHYSTDDLEFSSIIADFLITSLNNKEQILDIPLFFKHISDFLMLKDKFQLIRFGWILGIPQNKEAALDEYCLSYSDRSDYMKYISGINFKKAILQNAKKPLLQLANERKNLDSVFNIYCIRALLLLVLADEDAFDYMLNLPPPNYHIRTYFDWIGGYLSNLSKDGDVIIEKKMETFIEMNNMLEIIMEKVKNSYNLLPVQKYIIGKTKQQDTLQKVVDMNYEVTLKRFTTYVLENKPTGDENQSMPKKYFSSQDPKGIGHAFIYHRSKMNYESEAKEVKTLEALYVLTGKTKIRLIIIFKGKKFKHQIILNEGDFTINFPVEMNGDIKDLLQILPFSDYKIDIIPEELEKVFQIEKKKDEQIMEEEKGDFNPAVPAAAAFTEPKIKCNRCTYDNELTNDHCEMCDNPLYI